MYNTNKTIEFKVINSHSGKVYKKIVQKSCYPYFDNTFDETEYEKNLKKILSFFVGKSVFIGSECKTVDEFISRLRNGNFIDNYVPTLDSFLKYCERKGYDKFIMRELVCENIPGGTTNGRSVQSIMYVIELIENKN